VDAAQFGRAELRARVLTAWLAGGSTHQVAARCQVSPHTVQAIIDATPGVVEERARRHAEAAEELRVAALAWSLQHPGDPLTDGATELGVPVGRLRTVLGERVGWHPPRRAVRRRYTDAQLLQHVRDWVLEHGPSAAGYRTAAQTTVGCPSLVTITGRFGSWRHALEAAGLALAPPGRPGRSRDWSDDALAALVTAYLAESPTPSPRGLGEWLTADPSRPSLSLVRRRLGTWPQLIRRAGGEPDPPPT